VVATSIQTRRILIAFAVVEAILLATFILITLARR
jgi:hypothetical protein